jgi:hypothetical protein
MMRRLKLWIPYVLNRLGPVGVAGLLLIVGGVAANWLLVAPEVEAGQRLEQEWRRVEQAAASGRKVQPPADVLDGLARDAEVPAVVSGLFASAKEAGLALAKGEYRLTAGKAGELGQYQINLPLTGDYPKLRDFLDGAMRRPGLALDSLRLARANVETDKLEARAQFTLFVRGAR